MEHNYNYDIVNKYFDLVQQEIKKLISEDPEIKPSQIEEFNAQIFNQPEEITAQIRELVDSAYSDNVDIKKVAKTIYDKFKVQVKNNVFNTTDKQDVPNPLVGERKHIKTFEAFINERSYFHSMEYIDSILDKINDSGYASLDDSDLAILYNYSKDDEDIHKLLVKMNKLTKRFKELNQKISVAVPSDSEETLNKLKDDWLKFNSQMKEYENKLRYLYKIEDPNVIWAYQDKHGLRI